jgi:hypothetical protein
VPVSPTPGTHAYPGTAALKLNEFALRGTWNVTGELATAVRDAQIDVAFQAAHVYLVLSSRGDRPRAVDVLLDGRPVTAPDAGADTRAGTATVRSQRLYELVSLRSAQQRRLSLRLAPGVSAYAFTFG